MERILLYWDELDDLVSTAGMFAETLRNVLIGVFASAALIGSALAGGWLALNHPPLALALLTLLLTGFLFYKVLAGTDSGTYFIRFEHSERL